VVLRERTLLLRSRGLSRATYSAPQSVRQSASHTRQDTQPEKSTHHYNLLYLGFFFYNY